MGVSRALQSRAGTGADAPGPGTETALRSAPGDARSSGARPRSPHRMPILLKYNQAIENLALIRDGEMFLDEKNSKVDMNIESSSGADRIFTMETMAGM